jgi:hypothetical protein
MPGTAASLLRGCGCSQGLTCRVCPAESAAYLQACAATWGVASGNVDGCWAVDAMRTPNVSHSCSGIPLTPPWAATFGRGSASSTSHGVHARAGRLDAGGMLRGSGPSGCLAARGSGLRPHFLAPASRHACFPSLLILMACRTHAASCRMPGCPKPGHTLNSRPLMLVPILSCICAAHTYLCEVLAVLCALSMLSFSPLSALVCRLGAFASIYTAL